MRIWIDTEFNGFEGELISLALVDEEGRAFYGILPCIDPKPWVARHVIPVLDQCRDRMAIGKRFRAETHAVENIGELQGWLGAWLRGYDAVHLVADWPEDIAHFCRVLITGPGTRLDSPALTMEIRRDLDAASLVPHNALEDARAMRAVHLAHEKAGRL